MKGNANIKILALSHFSGNVGVMQKVDIWLDGKRIVDFLLRTSSSAVADKPVRHATPRQTAKF